VMIMSIIISAWYTGYERTLVTCVPNSHLKRVTVQYAALVQFILLKMSTIVLETCREM